MSQNPASPSPDDAIRQLALDIHLLDELRESNNKFNIFKVLKIDQYEIRHSQMLAWLLDPQENHGLGDTFLRNFLREAFSNGNVEDTNSAHGVYQELLLSDLCNFKVKREVYKKEASKNRFMDIVLSCDSPHKTLIIIENKIHAKEGNNQTSGYRSIIEKDTTYERYCKIFIYLSADGDRANEQGWINLTYTPIVDALETSLKGKCLPSGTDFFINHYLLIIKELSESDTSINGLCRSIYKKHKNAIDAFEHKNFIILNSTQDYMNKKILQEYRKEIDLIIKYKIKPQDIVLEQIKKRNHSLRTDEAKRYIEFYTEEMDSIFPGGKGTAYKYFFYTWQDSVGVYFELLGEGYDDYKDVMDAAIRWQMSNGRRRSVNDDGRPFNQYRRIFSKIEYMRTGKNMEEEVKNCATVLLDYLDQKQTELVEYLKKESLVPNDQ